MAALKFELAIADRSYALLLLLSSLFALYLFLSPIGFCYSARVCFLVFKLALLPRLSLTRVCGTGLQLCD